MECCSELLANPKETVTFSLTRIPPPQDATCPWRSWCAASHWFVNRVVSSIKWESAVLSNNGSFLFFSHLQCRRTMNWNITKEAQNKKKKKTSENKGIRELKYQDLNPLTWGCDEHGLPPISRNQPRKLKEWRNCLLTNEDSNESRYNLCFSSVHAADGPWPCFKNKIKKEKEY